MAALLANYPKERYMANLGMLPLSFMHFHVERARGEEFQEWSQTWNDVRSHSGITTNALIFISECPYCTDGTLSLSLALCLSLN